MSLLINKIRCHLHWQLIVTLVPIWFLRLVHVGNYTVEKNQGKATSAIWILRHVGLLIGLLASKTGRGVRRRIGGVAAI